MIKVNLVGVGGISGCHIPAWERIEGAELTALCDIDGSKLEKYPDKRGYTDFAEMLETEKPDLVDICTPTYTHVELALAALEKGIHVLCEKPLSLKAEDADRIYDAAERNHVKFMVAQVVRFWREYDVLKQLYDTKKYGDLVTMSMWRLSGIPLWSTDHWMEDETRSGLTPFDMHIHDLDYCVYAFGKPNAVTRHRQKLPHQDTIDGTYVYDDFYIHIETAWYEAQYPFNAGYRAQFETAVLELSNDRFFLCEQDGTVVDLTEEQAAERKLTLLPTNAYENEIRYFFSCVAEDRPVEKIRREEVRAVLELASGYREC